MNGATDREYTLYYIKVARHHLGLAVDVLAQLIRHPLIEADEMERERGVVIEELAMVADSPSQMADLLLDSLLWPDNPLGRDIAGTPETVAGISRDTLLAYRGEQYVPNNMVISVAGNVVHDEVVYDINTALGDWETGAPASWQPAPAGNGNRCAVRYKSTEQAHLTLAVHGIPLDHPDRYALSYLSVILGEGMSSRLFVELREKRGLVYDISSFTSQFLDTGAFHVYTGVDPRNAVEAVKVITAELARLAAHGPTGEELAKARELSKGRMMLRMEDTRAVGGWIGAQELLLRRVRTVEEAVAEMEAVTIEDLQRVARELLDPRGLYLAVVGPYRSDKRFATLLPS
jgi:predicted Zn-dependent peptidase